MMEEGGRSVVGRQLQELIEQANGLRQKDGRYAKEDVDAFIALVAEALEQLTVDRMRLRDLVEELEQRQGVSAAHERAIEEALLVAQELRTAIRDEAERYRAGVYTEVDRYRNRALADVEAAEKKLVAIQEAIDRNVAYLESLGPPRVHTRELPMTPIETGSQASPLAGATAVGFVGFLCSEAIGVPAPPLIVFGLAFVAYLLPGVLRFREAANG